MADASQKAIKFIGCLAKKVNVSDASHSLAFFFLLLLLSLKQLPILWNLFLPAKKSLASLRGNTYEHWGSDTTPWRNTKPHSPVTSVTANKEVNYWPTVVHASPPSQHEGCSLHHCKAAEMTQLIVFRNGHGRSKLFVTGSILSSIADWRCWLTGYRWHIHIER